ncbi:MAG: hypothetical protein JXR97_17150 [Planctomycetes bacterium]|nr:hypothetical protein [Planctomycetota bacterium]
MRLRLLLTLVFAWVAAMFVGGTSPVFAGDETAGDDAQEVRDNPLDAAEKAILQSILDSQERQTRAANYVRKGQEQQKAEMYSEALESYRAALRLDPNNIDARKGENEMKRYLEARGDETSSLIGREIEKAKIYENHNRMEALSFIQTAEDLIIQATTSEQAATDTASSAKMYVSKLKLLESASENLERATLSLNSLPARMDPGKELKRVKVMQAQVKKYQGEYSQALTDANNQISLEEERKNQVDIDRNNELQRAEYLRRAQMHRDIKEYAKAEKIVNELLYENPADSEAESLLQDIRRRRLAYREERISDLEVEERKRVIEHIDAKSIPIVSPSNLIKYPSDWDVMVRRKKTAGTAEREESDETRKVRQRLQQRYTLDFEQQDATEVLQQLRHLSGINIIYNPGPTVSVPPITLSVNEMRMDNILNWIMTITGLHYEITDGVVHITSAEELQGGVMTEVYDVRDLIRAVSDARTMPTDDDDDDDDDDEEESDLEQISIQEIIERVMPDAFGEGGDNAAELDDIGNLTIRAPLALQNRVKSLLDKLRAAQAIQVSVTARFLTVTDDFWEEFTSQFTNIDDRYTNTDGYITDPANAAFNQRNNFDMVGRTTMAAPAGILSVYGDNLGSGIGPTTGLQAYLTQSGYLGPIQTSWAVTAIKESQKADELFAPHVVVYNNRYGWFRSHTQIPYVYTYILAPAGVDLEPVIQYLYAGTSLQVRPIVSADKKYITLDLYPRVTKVPLPMATYNLTGTSPLYGDIGMPIDLPTVFEHRAETYATMPDGGSIYISGMAVNVHNSGRNGVPLVQDIPIFGNLFSSRSFQKEKRNFALMVNARMILLDEEEAKQTR